MMLLKLERNAVRDGVQHHQIGGPEMSVPKCAECQHGRKASFPRNGNGASWRSGHFYQDGVACLHEKPGGTGIFFGKTSPKTCPLRRCGE